MWICVGCGGPAEREGETVRCLDAACGVVRILPALPERLPWETEG